MPIPWKSRLAAARLWIRALTSRNALTMASDGVPCLGLHVVVRDQVAGHLAGQLADGVRTHAVGDHEDMPAAPPDLGVRGPDGRVTVLVVRAPHARVGCRRVDDDVVPVHGLTLCVWMLRDRHPLIDARYPGDDQRRPSTLDRSISRRLRSRMLLRDPQGKAHCTAERNLAAAFSSNILFRISTGTWTSDPDRLRESISWNASAFNTT